MFILFTLTFLLADLFVQTRETLPSSFLIITLLLLFLLFLLRIKQLKQKKISYIMLVFLLGISWTTWNASSLLSWQLPPACEGMPLYIKGHIASLPTMDQWQQRFVFSMQEMHCDHYISKRSANIRLSWRNNKIPLHVGDKWQLIVKLKRIHSTKNPGAFDFEAWALQKSLRANGYVVANVENKLIVREPLRYPIQHIRGKLQEKILSVLPHTKTAPWLLALMIGERNNIANEDWQVLRYTGTNHLMAIAGLHIGLLAGFVHLLFSLIWRGFPRLLLYVPANQAGACAALIVGVIYSALAGFSLPTERACLMLSAFSLALFLRRKINPWHAWSLALLVVLIINPLSVLSESFWLSFCTIALIIYGMRGRVAPKGVWWRHGRVQWVIGFGLIPLSLALFNECSLVSFLANSIAIPWLGFFILPLCFLSDLAILFSPSTASLLLWLADKSLTGLWVILTWFSTLDFSIWTQAIPNHFILVISVIGILLLLLPAGFPGRWFGIVWLLPLLCFDYDKPKKGEVWLTLLDVGQGLSAVVQTKSHLLVYDAGPKFNDSFDMGESVVLPYLQTIGAKRIDMLVISHGDNDHIGGSNALRRAFPLSALLTSVPDKLPSDKTSYCLAGNSWVWDQVRFSFLYPALADIGQGNDSSCVLLIEQNNKRILLTGDIEKLAEANLLMRAPEKLAADILVAPHHGSKTSGQKKFVSAVHPAYVLYATGYRNRYRFPHQSVVRTYEAIGSKQLETAKYGAIMFKIGDRIEEPMLYRITKKRYWFD